MLENYRIYENIQSKSFHKLLASLQSNLLNYKPNETIAYSISNRDMIGILEIGKAAIIRFDYDGKRTIVEELEAGDIFSDMFFSSNSSELSVIAKDYCKVIFIEYHELVKKCQTNQTAIMFLNNLFRIAALKLVKRNERVELLTTRSIRNKLLTYFELESKKSNSKSFNLPYSYTDLADYLAIDRSAMMRELKNLKEDKLIRDVNKRITLLY